MATMLPTTHAISLIVRLPEILDNFLSRLMSSPFRELSMKVKEAVAVRWTTSSHMPSGNYSYRRFRMPFYLTRLALVKHIGASLRSYPSADDSRHSDSNRMFRLLTAFLGVHGQIPASMGREPSLFAAPDGSLSGTRYWKTSAASASPVSSTLGRRAPVRRARSSSTSTR